MSLQVHQAFVRYSFACKRRRLQLNVHCKAPTKQIEQSQVSEDTNLYYIRKCNENSKQTATFLGLKNKDQKLLTIPKEELIQKIQDSENITQLLFVFDRQEHQFDELTAIETLKIICQIVNQHTRKEERVRMLCRRMAEFIQPELRNLSLEQIVAIITYIAQLKFTFVKLPRSRSNINPYQRRKGAVGLNLFRDLLNVASQVDDSAWNQSQIAQVLWSQARVSVVNRFLFLKLLRNARSNMHEYSSSNAATILNAQEQAGIRIPELTEGLVKQMAQNADNMNIGDIAKMILACAKFNNYDEKLFDSYLKSAQNKFRWDGKFHAISQLCYSCYLTQHFNPEFFNAVVEFMLQNKLKIYNINHYDAAQLFGAFAQFDIAQPDIMLQLQSILIDKTDNRDCDKLMTALFSCVLLQQPAWMCREVCDHFMILLAHEYKVVRRKIRRELPKDWYLKLYLCHVICEVYKRPIPINDKLLEVSKRNWKQNVESQVQSQDNFKISVVQHLNILNVQNLPNYVLRDWFLLIDIVIDLQKRVCVQLIRPGNLAANNHLVELHPSVMSRKLLEQLGWKVVPINQILWDQYRNQEQKLDFLQDLLEKYQI